jgi:hypothetical protein
MNKKLTIATALAYLFLAIGGVLAAAEVSTVRTAQTKQLSQLQLSEPTQYIPPDRSRRTVEPGGAGS